MDYPQEQANQLIDKTGTLLCLDCPEGMEFGIDCHSWTIGPLFQGIKLVPYGIHILFFSLPNPHGGEGASRVSFFVDFNSNQPVHVRKWNPKDENFFPDMDSDEVERYQLGVKRRDFDQNLGPYPAKSETDWSKLSSFITPQTVARIQPKTKSIASSSKPVSVVEDTQFMRAMAQSLPKPPVDFSAGIPMDEDDEIAFSRARAKEMEQAPQPEQDPFTLCRYFQIPKRVWNAKLSPTEITQRNFDKSSILKQFITAVGSYREVLAELQFAFVTFFVGQSFESFEHWKSIVEVSCRCQQLIPIPEYQEFYIHFITILRYQTELIPSDFFEDIIGGNNFLVQTLKEFFEIVDLEDDTKVAAVARQFSQEISDRFGVSFSQSNMDELEGDDAPAVVDVQEMLKLGLTESEIAKILENQ